MYCMRLSEFFNKANTNSEYKEYIGHMFMQALKCDDIDGSFKGTITNDDGTILQKIINYNNVICGIIGIQLKLPNVLQDHHGRARKTSFSPEKLDSAFTYAFVLGPDRSDKEKKAFSFTEFDE